jgi:hypothetical protein
MTREDTVEEIMRLEIEVSKLEHRAGGRNGSIYGSNLFPEYLKIMRKLQKLRDSL